VNVLHIEQVINSQIQQGTSHSQQIGTWQGLSGEQLVSLVAEIRTAFAAAALSADQRADADAHLATLEAQSKAAKPNQSIVREALKSLRTVAEQVAATLIAAKLFALIAAATLV
jgi:hypothetical protein